MHAHITLIRDNLSFRFISKFTRSYQILLDFTWLYDFATNHWMRSFDLSNSLELRAKTQTQPQIKRLTLVNK